MVHTKKVTIMAKYVFLNMPGRGHVNPTLAVARELVRRGQEVIYYLTEEFHDTIQATGATFRAYKMDLSNVPLPFNTMGVGERREDKEDKEGGTNVSSGGSPGGGFTPMAFFSRLTHVPVGVMDSVRADQPDVIVYDSLCLWARQVIDELHVPAIATFASFASNEHVNMMTLMRENMKDSAFARSMQTQMAKMGMNSQAAASTMSQMFSRFSRVEQLNIVFIPKELQPQAETFDNRYVFVGPSIAPRHDAPDFPFEQLKSERPLLYISLGSVFNNQPEFYKQCFAAFADSSWQVVLSIGKRTDETTLGTVPANFLLSPYVPQLDMLPRTRVFVTHAGANSIMEGMYFGVPMVLIPQQPEQYMNAQRIVDLGMGVLLEKENLTPQTLREAVEQVGANATYHEHAQRMRQSMHNTGGYQQAVDAILQFTKKQAK